MFFSANQVFLINVKQIRHHDSVEDKGGNRPDAMITTFFVCSWGSRRFKIWHVPMQVCTAYSVFQQNMMKAG